MIKKKKCREVKFNINDKENDLSVKRLTVPQLGKLHQNPYLIKHVICK